MQGIVVKVVHKKLYSLQKGVVEGVEDQFTALVRILDTGDKVKFDQAHLETVIPAIGNVVLLYSIPVSVYMVFRRGHLLYLYNLRLSLGFLSLVYCCTFVCRRHDYNIIARKQTYWTFTPRTPFSKECWTNAMMVHLYNWTIRLSTNSNACLSV